MGVNSLRADGWQDVAAFLVTAMVAVFFWYSHDLYLHWLVVGAGGGAGVFVVRISEVADDHPVAGFPPTMVFIVIMLVAIRIQSLVSGVVAALTVATAIKGYNVYLS